jgi:hypothetical protein
VLLCATRFWVGAGGGIPLTTPTLRRGVRSVATKQAVSSAQLDKAERELARDGLVKRAGKTLALTNNGVKVSREQCYRFPLPPWDWSASYRGRLDGVHRRRKAKR